ncbi:hypothetical protein [Fimbriiglobus ruber]|uniref:Uncharacterized protein n=1 Tax=Fimbriiglobus ruber TaxID=1908690 RepID=A0A225DKW4_9BACT|nr:hypothetical protein [Fimbriiglobus ruber]OWK42042.1 hypothetical protein FRUB_04120 [Fimbriiglobus ruber]
MKNIMLTWSLTSLFFVTIILAEFVSGDAMHVKLVHAANAADIFAGR